MVEIKLRNGEIGKCETKLDVKMEGTKSDIFWVMVELEEALYEILTQIENNSSLEVKKQFVHNLHDRYLDEAFGDDD